MSDCCGSEVEKQENCCKAINGKHGWDCRYRWVLLFVLLVNAFMFLLEILYGLHSGSQALLADAIDFLSDAFNYGISLYVLNKSLSSRALASLIKGSMMGALGVVVLLSSVYKIFFTQIPQAEIMGAVGFMALMANIISAAVLYKFRSGDSNRKSVWICSRNDAIGNIAVMIAAAGVFASASKWPDLIVAFIMAGLALSGAWRIITVARKELKS